MLIKCIFVRTLSRLETTMSIPNEREQPETLGRLSCEKVADAQMTSNDLSVP